MAKITINGISDDPLARQDELAFAGTPLPDASGSDYVVLETHRWLNQQGRNELASQKLTVLEYIGPNTYLCHYPEINLEAIRSLPNVVGVGPYPRNFKLAPSLRSQTPMLGPEHESTHEMEIEADPSATNVLSEAVNVLGAGGGLDFAESPDPGVSATTVDVVFHDNVNPKDDYLRYRVAAAAHLDANEVALGYHKARITVEPQYLSDVAQLDEVHHVEPVLKARIHSNIARQLIGLGVSGFPPPTPFEGSGQMVVVADTGFDIGRKDNVHHAFTDRVEEIYPLDSPAIARDRNGHGTHVAGSVLGDGTSVAEGRVRGAAPKAQLIVQALSSPEGVLARLPVDLQDLFLEPYDKNGARIHNNSWGKNPGMGQYNADAQEVDEFVWKHRDCVICFSAGDEGTDSGATGQIAQGSITPPGTAKNCISVGASENNRPEIATTYRQFSSADFPAEPIASHRMAQNPEGIAAFSSRGPTEQGRIKPDLVAPGTCILSAASRAAVSNGSFSFNSGTSMSTPLVAGCAAVVREFLAKQHEMLTPSAALVKALLINGARQIAGQFDAPGVEGIPNIAAGFGRVDMAATVGPLLEHQRLILHDESEALVDQEPAITQISIIPPVTTLKATLVWTDPPGATLQNDLDLIVKTADGRERHGNMKPDSADFDRKNNVEQVMWTNIPEGAVEVIVKADRLSTSAQTYALVIRTT